MDILIQNSRGELLTVAIEATDTFDALAKRMLDEYGLRMDFENLTDRGNAIKTQDIIVNFLERNEQRPALMADYPTGCQIFCQKSSDKGITSAAKTTTTEIFGTIILKPRAPLPEEIYHSDEEGSVLPGISNAGTQQEPMESDSLALCRLCALENDDMTPIHGIGDDQVDIIGHIRECFSIVVSRNDDAKNICAPCLESLRRFVEFRRNVMRNNEKFVNSKKNRAGGNRQQLERDTFVRHFCTVCNRVSSQNEIVHESRCHSDNCNGDIVPITLNSMYRCEYCQSCYSNVESLKRHRSRNHADNSSTPYVCSLCNVACATYNDIATHSRNEHGKFTFGGNEEDAAAATTTAAIQNRRIPRYFVCPYCDRTFAHFEDMNVHRNFCKTANDYRCRACRVSFVNSEELASHTRGGDVDVQVERKWQCQNCDASFGSRCALEIHAEKHAQTPKIFACEDCGKHFFKREYLSNHAKVHAGERPFVCPLCNKGFVNLARLTEHKKIIHSDEKHYKCKFCDKAFKRPNARKAHMAIHTGEKSYNCDICSGSFRRNGDLRKHKKIIHDI